MRWIFLCCILVFTYGQISRRQGCWRTGGCDARDKTEDCWYWVLHWGIYTQRSMGTALLAAVRSRTMYVHKSIIV